MRASIIARMKKLRLSARSISVACLATLVLGIATLAFSQLATGPESPAGDASDQVSAIRQKIESLEATMADTRSAQAGLRKRSQTDRLAREVASAGNGLSGVPAASASPIAQKIKALSAQLEQFETELDTRQGESARTLSGVEGRLEESKGIFKDALDNSGGNVEEVAPILRIVSRNLDNIDNELQAVSQLVSIGEKEAGLGVESLSARISTILDEIAKARSVAGTKPQGGNVLPATSTAGSKGVTDAVNSINPGTSPSRFGSAIRSDGGDVTEARRIANERNLSQASLDDLRSQLATSRNVQVALSEDTEKLQSDLRRAYREIVSLQSGLKESERLVGELEESRTALLKARGQNASGVEAVSRMVNRLESELKSSRDELKLARQSLLSEQDRSNTMIRTLSSELERTRKELDSARVAAAATGADAGRLLTLEQELDRTQKALLEARANQGKDDPEIANKLREELRKALIEITRLEAELTGKEELEKQLATMRETIKQMGDGPNRAVSPEYVNKLLLELNAAKVAVDQAKAESENLRAQLSGKIKSLHGNIGQSQVDLDKSMLDLQNAREAMARREFEFASTIKELEDELQQTQLALQEATQGAIRKVPVVGDMEKTLSESQVRMDALTRRFDQEQNKAAELVSALQVELETTKRRHEATLQELFDKEKLLKGQEQEMQRNRKEVSDLKAELDEVETIATQLQQLNEVLDDTKSTQNTQVADADRIIGSLREQLNEAQVELVFAKEAKDKAQESAASQVVALEHQLEQTREQLSATQATMYDRASGSKGLIQDLKTELDEARKEIARLKTMGAGDSVGAQQAVAQLQEALGTIRILQESLDQAEQVNTEVDGLRSELANAMQSQLATLERSELEKERLHSKVADLELELKVLAEEGSGKNVNYAKAMAGLNDKFQASQNQVASLEAKLAQSENSGVGTISGLEEQLELARSRNNQLQAQMQQALQTKAQTLELLERELALANQKLDDMEALQTTQGSPQVAELERRLMAAKLQLDEMAKQREETDGGSELAEQLKAQLLIAESKFIELEAIVKASDQDQVIGKLQDLSRLEDDLAKAQSTISDLQGTLQGKELQQDRLRDQLAQAVQGMEDFKNAGQNTAELRKQLEKLRTELSLAGSGTTPAVSPESDQRVAKLREEVENLKTELELARALASRQPKDSSTEPSGDLRVAELKGEIESLRAELDLAKELASRPVQGNAQAEKLKGQLAEKVGEVIDLTSQLDQANKRLVELQSVPGTPSSSAEIDELKKTLASTQSKLDAAEAARASDLSKLDDLLASKDASKVLREDLNKLKEELAAAKAAASTAPDNASMDNLKEELGQVREELRVSESKVQQLKVLGSDLALLQQELVAAKNAVPTPSAGASDSLLNSELARTKDALNKSEADVVRLNDEFKRSMQDFSVLKGRLAALEAENASLMTAANNAVVATPGSPSMPNQLLRNERDAFARENAALRAQLQDRDGSLRSLRQNMAGMSVPGSSPGENELRARLMQAESQLDTARSAEQRAKLDFQRADEELKEANRRLLLVGGDLNTARSRVAEMEAIGRSPAPGSPSLSVAASSAASGAINQLQAENDRLKQELALAQAGQAGGELGREVQELRQKQLIANMQLEREQTKIADLQKQLQEARQVKREDFEKDRAQRQQITLQDEELKVARSRVSELENAVVSLREAIRVLRSGGSGDSQIRSLGSSSSSPPSRMFPSPSSGRGVGGGFASAPAVSMFPSARPLPLPGRRGAASTSRFGSPTGVLPSRPSVPVARTVPRGQGSLQLSATVEFLNNKVRPAGDIEFFVLREDLEAVVKRAGINLPVEQGITSAAELWARSVQSGYRYPGVAAHIRNALADSNLARIKTNASGAASVGSLAAGTYHLVGTAPLGRVGVVWSKSFDIQPGQTNNLNLDLRDASWAQ